MNIYLDESKCKDNLKPIAATRHVADIRVGMHTIREKWELLLKNTGHQLSLDPHSESIVVIPANIIPHQKNYQIILEKAINHEIYFTEPAEKIEFPWHIYQLNHLAIAWDFELIDVSGNYCNTNDNNKLSNASDIFIHKSASVQHCILNANEGPIYIGENVTIMEGSCIRGPFVALEGSVVKMGSRIYGATTLGPKCTVGGEIKNVVFQGYSNKAHDGYLGDSAIGAWCNFGAGTSNSNLKNTASEVKYKGYHYTEGIAAGKKAGLIMGDFSRTAINSAINTGTIIGVSCNYFGSGLSSGFLPDFTWGEEEYIIEKAIRDASNWMRLKGEVFTIEMEQNFMRIWKERNEESRM